MTLGELIDEYRTKARDKRRPYFCDDAELTKLVNDAIEEAAIRSRLIPATEEIGIDVGESRYPMPSYLFEVRTAELIDAAGKRYPVSPKTRDELDYLKPGWRHLTERPEFFVVDDTELVIGCIPDATYTLSIEGYRTPRKKLSTDKDVPEIHPANHAGLLHWVLYKAFGNQDADLFDPNRAAAEEAEFTRQFGKRPSADLRKRQSANRPHRNRIYL